MLIIRTQQWTHRIRVAVQRTHPTLVRRGCCQQALHGSDTPLVRKIRSGKVKSFIAMQEPLVDNLLPSFVGSMIDYRQ